MTKANDGGPAFPTSQQISQNRTTGETVACVIRFSPEEREPRLISWNSLPDGTHHLYTAPPADSLRTSIKQAGEQSNLEPVAMRGDFDGYGYRYTDNGHGSNWRERHPDWEPLYTHPAPAQPDKSEELLTKIAQLEKQSMECGAGAGCCYQAARVEQLELENAELRKDAERYRFIRDADRSDCISQEISLYAMGSLDEYVDAALAGEAATKEHP